MCIRGVLFAKLKELSIGTLTGVPQKRLMGIWAILGEVLRMAVVEQIAWWLGLVGAT